MRILYEDLRFAARALAHRRYSRQWWRPPSPSASAGTWLSSASWTAVLRPLPSRRSRPARDPLEADRLRGTDKEEHPPRTTSTSCR